MPWKPPRRPADYSLKSPSFDEPSASGLLCCAFMRPNEPQAMTVIIQPRPKKRSVSMPKRGDENVLLSGILKASASGLGEVTRSLNHAMKAGSSSA